MTPSVETTTPDATVQSAASRMSAAGVTFLPVVEGDRVIGTLTDRDITLRLTAAGLNAKGRHVRDVMTPTVARCFDDQSLAEAERLMANRHTSRLVVVDRSERVVGVLSAEALGARERSDVMADARSSQPVVLCGSAHPEIAAALARELGVRLGSYGAQRFPDGEIHAEVGTDIHARHAVVVQPTGHPGGERLLELVLMADACRRAGASAISAVIPYVGYARQDHRTRPGQALGMRVVAELLGSKRFDHIVAVDLHSDGVEGFFDVPLEHLSAVPLLAEAVRPHAGKGAVIVSPDLGAAKLAREYARILGLPVAMVHKTRMSPLDVAVERVVGDVRGLRPILVDDMITTGGTIVAAARALFTEGSARDLIAVATHPVLVPPSVERLHEIGIRRLVVSNTLPSPKDLPFACEVVDVAPLLAGAVRRVCAVR